MNQSGFVMTLMQRRVNGRSVVGLIRARKRDNIHATLTLLCTLSMCAGAGVLKTMGGCGRVPINPRPSPMQSTWRENTKNQSMGKGQNIFQWYEAYT